MASRDCDVARRACLELLWGRRGGVFRQLFAVKFRLAVTRLLKSIGSGCCYSSSMPRDRICYGERQLSFEETPVFRIKMYQPGGTMRSRFCLPRIPCISPDVDFNYGFGDDEDSSECDWERRSLVADGDRGEHVYGERAS